MKLIYLSEAFYRKFSGKNEILEKETRPYLCLSIKIENNTFAIPLRHHIGHPYCLPTLPPAGLDFTKSIVIEDDKYISDKTPRIDTREWNILKRNENKIFYEFRKFIRQYKRALRHPDNPRSIRLLKYCSLKYFEF